MELQIIDQRPLLGKDIAVYGTNEEPFFLAKDVAEWIDYSKSGNGSFNITQMVSTIDDDEKLVSTMLVAGQNRNVVFITEDGLYEVLMQSRKPIAKELKKGIKHILKEIRLNGGYIATNSTDTPEMIMARGLQVAMQTIENVKLKNKQLQIQNEIQQQQIMNDAPLVELAKDCYNSTGSYTASILSARLGFKSANALNTELKKQGIQYKVKGDDCWKLTSKYSGNGYTKTIPYRYFKSDGTPDVKNRMEWTEKGFVFLRQFFQKKANQLFTN